MDRVRLGGTGVGVTRLALGCAPLGGLFDAVGDEAARATVDAAWEAGLRAFDVAPHYGAGVAERRLGAALRDRPRDDYVLSTKVGRLLVRDAAPAASDPGAEFAEGSGLVRTWDFSADGVRRSLAASLERLGLDRIDVALVHDPEDHLDDAIGSALPALVALRDEGTIGAVGAGMNFTAPLARIVREADVDCVMVAGRYTLLDQSAADELLGLCAQRGVSILAAGLLNSGVLADPRPGAMYDYRPASEEVRARARRIHDVCARHGVAPVAAATRFALRHPAVACAVVGARSPDEVAGAAAATATAAVPDALWDDLVAAGLVRADAL